MFVGRDPEIAALLETLESMRLKSRAGGERLLLLLGASGSGKSSLVRAGVLPRLRRLPERWQVLPPMRPGLDPVRELALGLAAALRQDLETVAGRLAAAGPDGGGGPLQALADEVRLQAGQPEAAVLLVLDQMEELLDLSEAQSCGRFLDLLRRALEHGDGRLLVLATLRSEYLGEVQLLPFLTTPTPLPYREQTLDPVPLDRLEDHHPRAGAALAGSRSSSRTGWSSGWCGTPARATPCRCSPSPSTASGATPPRAPTGCSSSRSTSGWAGSRARCRPRPTRRLTSAGARRPSSRPYARPSCRAWCGWTRTGVRTRRRAFLADLTPATRALLKPFVDRGLLVTNRDPEGRETIEVAHEALLRTWPQLERWLAEDQDALRLLDGLERAARDWEAGKRSPELLAHRGARLAEVQALLGQPRFRQVIGDTERRYLEASIQAEAEREAREREERERRVRDAERIAEEQRKVARRTRR